MFEVGALQTPEGKKTNRPTCYPVNDGIDYSGIDFPTPVKQIDRLEAQNSGLAINLLGWENNCVIVHRISRKEQSVPRINLMLIESGEKQHYCYVKRVSALLYDQSKSHNTKHYYMLCLTGFSRADLLENHKKYCNGLKGRPTRIEMPKDGLWARGREEREEREKLHREDGTSRGMRVFLHGCEKRR